MDATNVVGGVDETVCCVCLGWSISGEVGYSRNSAARLTNRKAVEGGVWFEMERLDTLRGCHRYYGKSSDCSFHRRTTVASAKVLFNQILSYG